MSADSILGLLKSFSHLAVIASLRYSLTYLKVALIYFLCSTKLYKKRTTSTLEHGVCNNLNLCFCAMVTQNGSRKSYLLFPLIWELCFFFSPLLTHQNYNHLSLVEFLRLPGLQWETRELLKEIGGHCAWSYYYFMIIRFYILEVLAFYVLWKCDY